MQKIHSNDVSYTTTDKLHVTDTKTFMELLYIIFQGIFKRFRAQYFMAVHMSKFFI